MQFKLYDSVKFELSRDQSKPRWYLNTDYGSSGKYVIAFITNITDYAITVEYIDGHKRTQTFNFPNTKSSDYDPNQWTFPGYLQPYGNKKNSTDKQKDLIAETIKETVGIFNKKCCCGGDKANTTHATWCDVYKPY